MDKFILGTSKQTAKVFKTTFAKIGYAAVSKPQWVKFSIKKIDYGKFESWKMFFPYPSLGFFHQNHH